MERIRLQMCYAAKLDNLPKFGLKKYVILYSIGEYLDIYFSESTPKELAKAFFIEGESIDSYLLNYKSPADLIVILDSNFQSINMKSLDEQEKQEFKSTLDELVTKRG